MEMRTAPRLAILIVMVMAVMVSESWACRPLRLKFILEDGENSRHNDNIKIKNGLFESLPKGVPVPPSGPSQCRNFISPSGSRGGSGPVNEINTAGINAYPVLTDRLVGIARAADFSDHSLTPIVKRSSSLT
jgi:hypothetical protein